MISKFRDFFLYKESKSEQKTYWEMESWLELTEISSMPVVELSNTAIQVLKSEAEKWGFIKYGSPEHVSWFRGLASNKNYVENFGRQIYDDEDVYEKLPKKSDPIYLYNITDHPQKKFVLYKCVDNNYSPYDEKKISIIELEDGWFKVIYAKQPVISLWKCDQLDGVIDLLETLLPNFKN